MKKTLMIYGGLLAAAVTISACSKENEPFSEDSSSKGMTLKATVAPLSETRASIDDSDADWEFSFTAGDEIKVNNREHYSTFYTFTKGSTDFISMDAEIASGTVDWHAYYPSNNFSLLAQSGSLEDVASKYALAGGTGWDTNGSAGISITLQPKVAVLKIDNQKGAIDINVKCGESTWVTGMMALSGGGNGFTIIGTTTSTPQILFSTTLKGTYYVVVPANAKLVIKDGDNMLKSTNSLTAGKYYNLTIEPPK